MMMMLCQQIVMSLSFFKQGQFGTFWRLDSRHSLENFYLTKTVFSIILIGFRLGVILPPPSLPQNEALKSLPRLGLITES